MGSVGVMMSCHVEAPPFEFLAPTLSVKYVGTLVGLGLGGVCLVGTLWLSSALDGCFSL